MLTIWLPKTSGNKVDWVAAISYPASNKKYAGYNVTKVNTSPRLNKIKDNIEVP